MNATTNQMTPEQMAEATRKPLRAERRRDLAASRRNARYDESGFVDRSMPAAVPFATRDTDQMGNGFPRPFSSEDLMDRARARATQSIRFIQAALKSKAISVHEALRLTDRRAPHAQRSTAERKRLDRTKADTRRLQAFWTGVFNNANGLTADGKFLLKPSGWGERRPAPKKRNQEAPLAMAA